jgi:rhodanese-related sulfurtransferase
MERAIDSLPGQIRRAGEARQRRFSHRTVERQLADLERLIREHFGDRPDAEPVGIHELLKRVRSNAVVILDTRPANEYAAGHIAGALSIPVDDVQRRLRQLPRDKEYVAYCRGPYCVYADRAVEILRSHGRRARRLREGFPEWRAAGLPIATDSAEGRGGPSQPRAR